MKILEQQKLFKLIELALDQAPEHRRDWIKKHSPKELYSDALELLHASEVANTDNIDLTFELNNDFGRHEDYLGKQVGAYELVKLIGEGGMGYVFLGRRVDGAFEQQVAIKLIRLAMVGPILIRKFERERQILSDLNHPNIAALYDGGTTEDGVPYLVMEYVEGVSIDKYVLVEKPSIEKLLELFVKVCSAVQAAHRSLIIHRDIKPANILIGLDGQPKLLDFGIARSIDPVSAGADKTMLVQLTPTYASPEQIRNEVLGTATDVYSLGVVLFEALTGALPYEVSGLSAYKAEKLITQAAKPTPSRKSRDHLNLKDSLQANELDAIVLKSLATDIDRRYESAGALMRDLERFLNAQPVEAQLDTQAYRFRKLIARNKGVAIASCIAFVALACGLTVSLVQTHKATTELARAEAVGGYLRSLLLSPQPGANSPMQLGSEATVKDLLLAAELSLENDLADQPSVKIELYNTLSTAQLWMDDVEAALRMTKKAVELASDSNKATDYELMAAIHVQGTVLDDNYQGEAARRAYEKALEIARALGAEDSDDALIMRNDSAVSYANSNLWQDALTTQLEAVSIYKDRAKPYVALQSALLGNLGHFQFEAGQIRESERNLRLAIELSTGLSEATYYRLRSKQRLARLLDFTGRTDEAITAYQDSISQAQLKHLEAEEEIVNMQLRIAIIGIQHKNDPKGREVIETTRSQYEEYLGFEESWLFHAADAALQLADKNYEKALLASERAREFSLVHRQPPSERIRIDLLSAEALAGLSKTDEASELLDDVFDRTVAWIGSDSPLTREVQEARSKHTFRVTETR